MHFNHLIVLGLSLAAAGCASQPASRSAGDASPAPAAAATAATAPATAVEPAAASPATGGGAAQAKAATGTAAASAEPRVPPGYKLVERDGQILYCRSVTPLGTRFPSKVCMTEAEYRDFESRNESMRQDMSRRQICVGAHCGES